jgi:hypothetical protein
MALRNPWLSLFKNVDMEAPGSGRLS